MNYEICPKCNGLLELDGTCSCGYRPKTESKPKPRLCAFNNHGDSCHLPGYLSQTTYGEGPWYCRAHFAKIMGWPAETSEKPLSIAVEEITQDLKEPYRSRAIERQKNSRLEREPMSEVDKRVNKLVPRLDGESEHAWSMRCRLWVMDYVARLARPQEEPGANG